MGRLRSASARRKICPQKTRFWETPACPYCHAAISLPDRRPPPCCRGVLQAPPRRRWAPELDASIYVFPWDAKTGTLKKEVQVRTALPKGFDGKPWAAAIHLTPDGKFLYASQRTTSTLAAFRVDPKAGLLTSIDSYPTEKQPRGFNIDPTGRYLLSVGQLSNSLTTYAIDKATGKLTKLREYPMGKNPNWVEIISFAR
jgi:6-phosphogluconolactonase (cycloisomerase 2 family)